MQEGALFLKQIDLYHTINVEEAMALLEEQANGILFIGRETCPYCRKFSTTLSQVVKEKGYKIHFLHSQNPASDLEAISRLRAMYQVKTVPGFLIAKPSGVLVRCDSSLSKEAIIDLIEKK